MSENKYNIKISYLEYLGSLLLFGLNGVAASHISLTSYQIVLMRTLIGSVTMLVIFLLGRHHFTFRSHPKDVAFIGISGIAMGASWILLFEAYNQIGVSMASLLYYCGPVIIMIVAPFLFREMPTAAKIIGFAAVLWGVFLLNGTSSVELNRLGLICGLGSACLYAVMVLTNKMAGHIVGLENTLLQLVAAFITVSIFVGFKSGFLFHIEKSDIPWILFIGVVITGIGCWMYFTSIKYLPVQTVAICGYLEPLSAVVFAVLLLGETMTAGQVAGGVLIIGGAMFGELVKPRSLK